MQRLPRDVFVRHVVVTELERDAHACVSSVYDPRRPSWTRTLRNLARACRWTAGAIDASRVRELYGRQTMRYVDRLVQGWRTMDAWGTSFRVGYRGVLWAKFYIKIDSGNVGGYVTITTRHPHRNVKPVMEKNQLRVAFSQAGLTAYDIRDDEALKTTLCDTLARVLAGAPPEIVCARPMRLVLIDEGMRDGREVMIRYRGGGSEQQRLLRIRPRWWRASTPLYVADRESFAAMDHHGELRTYTLRKVHAVIHET